MTAADTKINLVITIETNPSFASVGKNQQEQKS